MTVNVQDEFAVGTRQELKFAVYDLCDMEGDVHEGVANYSRQAHATCCQE